MTDASTSNGHQKYFSCVTGKVNCVATSALSDNFNPTIKPFLTSSSTIAKLFGMVAYTRTVTKFLYWENVSDRANPMTRRMLLLISKVIGLRKDKYLANCPFLEQYFQTTHSGDIGGINCCLQPFSPHKSLLSTCIHHMKWFAKRSQKNLIVLTFPSQL